MRVGEDIDDDVALVVPTSGTTGTPKGAMSPRPLIASASATHDRLGGPGTWLLALPTHHIAGIQVLVRSLQAGTVPVEMDVSAGFDVTELPTAVANLGSGRRYTSLVATQLAKALLDPEATAALAELEAVLLGGGPAPRPVLEGAAAAGIAVVRTYGSSETAGGCVYDGMPLDGVEVRLDAGAEPGESLSPSAGRHSPRATATHPTRTRSPSRAGFTPTTSARSTRRADSWCSAVPTRRSAPAG